MLIIGIAYGVVGFAFWYGSGFWDHLLVLDSRWKQKQNLWFVLVTSLLGPLVVYAAAGYLSERLLWWQANSELKKPW